MIGGARRETVILSAVLALTSILLNRPLEAAVNLPGSDQPAVLSADQVVYDKNIEVVTASGNVEISQGDRVLLTDHVSYNTATNVVTASGNITLLEPSGDVVFADFAELTDDLKEGFIRDIRVLMSDRSRLAAASGVRTGGNRTVFSSAVYSPCVQLPGADEEGKLHCRTDPNDTPLWQIRAAQVIHDQEDQVIRYRHTWMEFLGVPVFYTPYFEHPDPTVTRQSGFLAPTIGNSDSLGTLVRVPYYIVIDDDKDATFAPILTENQGIVLAGEYRQLFSNGELQVQGSGTIADRNKGGGVVEEDELRGHIDAEGRFDFDQTWRWGFDAKRATDDTYQRLYNFSSERTLTSRAYVEGLHGRNYASANSYLYQGQRATDQSDESPIILPMLDYNFVSEPGVTGGRYALDANALVLTRAEGRDSRRLSLAGSWELPYTAPAGDIYSLTARLQTDAYWTDGVDPDSGAINPANPGGDDITGRIFPQLAAQWRYPWVRYSGNMQQVFEPIVQAVIAPTGSNSDDIPNEDSRDFEFDDTNLFSLNRFSGIDRVDPGPRVDYGLKWSVFGNSGGYTTAFLGQSYRLEEDDIFGEGSGLEDNGSDIVGRIQIKPTSPINVLYRFRLDKDDLQPRRSELDLSFGPPALNLTLTHTFIDNQFSDDEFSDREEIVARISSQITHSWSAFASHRRDLEKGDNLQTRIGLAYVCDCFTIEAIAERNFFSDREIESEDSIFIRMIFKNLGEISS